MKVPYPYLELQGISDQKVLQVIHSLPWELFVPQEFQDEDCFDSALSIDCRQTISQPFIVDYMTEKLELNETDKMIWKWPKIISELKSKIRELETKINKTPEEEQELTDKQSQLDKLTKPTNNVNKIMILIYSD